MAKKTSTKKPSTGERVTVRHKFTNEEYHDKANSLARALQLVSEKKEAVKAMAATAKAEIKSLESDVTEMANSLQNGYENVEVDALVEFNKKKGRKRYYYHCPGQPEHGNFIKESEMTEEDFQLLPLEEGPAKKDEPAADAEPAKEDAKKPLQEGAAGAGSEA